MEAYKIKPVLFLFALGFLAAKNFIQKKREISVTIALSLYCTVCTLYIAVNCIIVTPSIIIIVILLPMYNVH